MADDSKIRVLAINTEAHRGGAARIASMINGAVNRYADDVASILYHCGDRTRSAQVVGLRRIGNRQLNAALFRISGGRIIFDLGVVRALKEAARDAQLIHVHNLHGYYLDYRKLIGPLLNKPVVWTWHDMWGATGRCAFSFDCNGWKYGCIKCPNKSFYPSTLIDYAGQEFEEKTAYFVKNPRLFIASPSDWLGRIAVERGYERSRVFTIPNPVDLSAFKQVDKLSARQSLGLDSDSTYLLFVAADCGDPRKGFADFADVVNLLGVKGVAVGKRPRNIPGNVQAVGPARNVEHLNMYYGACDVLLMTSVMDNYPNTVIEAQASGTPVFGYAVGGVPEQLPDNVGGLVPIGRTDLLATAISDWIGSDGRNRDVSNSLRRFAIEKWSVNAAMKRYIDLYRLAIRFG